MKTVFLFVVLTTLTLLSASAQEDAADCKDSPMFNRMPGTVISECAHDFDEVDIPMTAENTEKKEGTKTRIQYGYTGEEATAPSFFQIVRNFENAIVKTGGKKIYFSKDAGTATLFTQSSGRDVWVVLNDFGGTKKGNFELTILEIEGMKQDIAAGEMLETLNNKGSISLSINFETGNAEIKPESRAIIDQLAGMLQASPVLNISVNGHTDNAGSASSNQSLSENRAKAVVSALVAKGIDKSRLSAVGWGAKNPVSDNRTEAGRAKNRRVEIVKL